MTDKDSKKDEIPKGYKRRKDLPSVDYLLKHGDPDTAHLPKTWKEIIGYPFALALIFAISLFCFHNAPWEKLPRKKPYTLPKMQQRTTIKQHQARVPHLNKKEEDTEF